MFLIKLVSLAPFPLDFCLKILRNYSFEQNTIYWRRDVLRKRAP